MKFLTGLALALSLSAPGAALADAGEWQQQALQDGLHEHRVWRQLLWLRPAGDRSLVLSTEFFLAPTEGWSARAELEATLRGWFAPAELGDAHPRCRFPARFAWLTTHLALPTPTDGGPECRAYRNWSRLDDLRSISVLHVSGYLGNPASSFGHSLIRLNHARPGVGSHLLDIGINYGALVPPEEPTPVYIFRGLFGGYVAGFSDRGYFAQDQVYARTEFRDIWDFELDLAAAERERLVAHLWEILGRKFTYYFLSKNCALRMAELLELATGLDVAPAARVWYAPIELFHRLQALDATAERPEGRRLIRGIEHIPSDERLLHRAFADLDADERHRARAWIGQADPDAAGTALSELAPQRQAAVLDALLAYYQYRLAGLESEAPAELLSRQNAVLLRRLQLPPNSSPPAPPAPLPPPSLGQRAGLIGIGPLRQDRAPTTTRYGLRWVPYLQGLLTSPVVDSRALVVLDTRFSFDRDGAARLDRSDFIRLAQHSLTPVPIPGERRRSWRLRLGLDRGPGLNDRLDGIVEAGLGWSGQSGRSLLGWMMLIGELSDRGGDHVSAGLELGINARLGPARLRLRADRRRLVERGIWQSRFEGEMLVPLSSRLAVAADWQQRGSDESFAASLHVYW